LSSNNRALLKTAVIGAVALAAPACAACSRRSGEASPGGVRGTEAPAPVPNANVAAADMGGAVEELTDNCGPGFTWTSPSCRSARASS
jgi:hypothetical protein